MPAKRFLLTPNVLHIVCHTIFRVVLFAVLSFQVAQMPLPQMPRIAWVTFGGQAVITLVIGWWLVRRERGKIRPARQYIGYTLAGMLVQVFATAAFCLLHAVRGPLPHIHKPDASWGIG